jgi:NADH-quinone oxidoreductase subunit M
MLLTGLIIIPLLGALPLCLVRDRNARDIKVWTFLVTLVVFAVSLKLWLYDPSRALFQFVENASWVRLKGGLSIDYALGVDGISALLILLTTLIMPLAVDRKSVV